MPEKAKVFFIDRNVHGAWVVYGGTQRRSYVLKGAWFD